MQSIDFTLRMRNCGRSLGTECNVVCIIDFAETLGSIGGSDEFPLLSNQIKDLKGSKVAHFPLSRVLKILFYSG